jgi:hypothetical protein
MEVMETVNSKIYVDGSNTLRLKWPVGKSINYGVRIVFDEEGAQNEVKYETRVTRLKPSATGEALFQIERISDVFVNETLPDLIADKLAHAAGKVFYPLIISVDKNGGFEGIANHQQILKRWEGAKANIMDNFEGRIIEDYVARMEKQLALRENVQTALLQNDWFLQTFFKPIYKTYGLVNGGISYKFPVLKSLMSDGYFTRENLQQQENDFGALQLIHEGYLPPDAEDPTAPTGSYEGFYVLHPQNKHIISIVSDLTYREQTTINIKVKIFMTPENGHPFDHDFAQDKTGAAYADGEGLVVIDGAPRKSFWDRILNI